jgi:hypothetical protein
LRAKSIVQKLIDLKNRILAGRNEDALAIIDELEGISKQANLRDIVVVFTNCANLSIVSLKFKSLQPFRSQLVIIG